MASGGARVGAGRPPKVHADGTVKPRKRKKLAPGEVPKPRGRPRKNPVAADAPLTTTSEYQTSPADPPSTPAPPQPPPPPPTSLTQAEAAQALANMVGYLPPMPADIEPLDMALVIMRDSRVHPETRLRCLQLSLPYRTPKVGADKKTMKEKQAEALEEVQSKSRFGATRAPLRAVGGAE